MPKKKVTPKELAAALAKKRSPKKQPVKEHSDDHEEGLKSMLGGKPHIMVKIIIPQ